MVWFAFAVGAMVGGMAGVMVMALLVAAREPDRDRPMVPDWCGRHREPSPCRVCAALGRVT